MDWLEELGTTCRWGLNLVSYWLVFLSNLVESYLVHANCWKTSPNAKWYHHQQSDKNTVHISQATWTSSSLRRRQNLSCNGEFFFSTRLWFAQNLYKPKVRVICHTLQYSGWARMLEHLIKCFHAQEHLGVSLAKLLEQCDSASICLSKVHFQTLGCGRCLSNIGKCRALSSHCTLCTVPQCTMYVLKFFGGGGY